MIAIVYAPPGISRADGYNAVLVSTTTDSENAAKVKAEKLCGLYDGSGQPSHFRHYVVTKIRTGSIWAHNGSGWVPDVCFRGAHVVGPLRIHPSVSSYAEAWPRLDPIGHPLPGVPWLWGD